MDAWPQTTLRTSLKRRKVNEWVFQKIRVASPFHLIPHNRFIIMPSNACHENRDLAMVTETIKWPECKNQWAYQSLNFRKMLTGVKGSIKASVLDTALSADLASTHEALVNPHRWPCMAHLTGPIYEDRTWFEGRPSMVAGLGTYPRSLYWIGGGLILLVDAQGIL